MNCPKCNCPNPQGATHCGMCYEVFNRSAADAYLRQVRRDRLMREKEEGPSETKDPALPPADLKNSLRVLQEKLPPIDWERLAQQAKAIGKHYLRPALWTVGILGMVFAANTLRSPAIWYGIFGYRPQYSFSGRGPVRYLSSYTTEFKSWSERLGSQAVDTPLQEFRLDEFGNLSLEKSQLEAKRIWALTARPVEWLIIRREHGASAAKSQMLSLRHGSLAGGRIFFNRKGTILRRDYPLTVRMGRSLNFAVPALPAKRLREGRSWTDTMVWVEAMGDWRVRWQGKVTWTLQEFVSEGNDKTVRISGEGALRPQLLDGPVWAAGGLKQAFFKGPPAHFTLVFDRQQNIVLANTVIYSGTMMVPIHDLASIPWSLRIGRRVRGPGRLVLNFKNRIDLRQN
jgi:hypothetical protein